MNTISFRIMALEFAVRDMIRPPENKVNEAGIRPGSQILDYGCGPGSYSIAAARLTGDDGKVYALDILPVAIQMVRKKAEKKEIKNIVTILSGCKTCLDDESIDTIVVYDVFHDLINPSAVLIELHRVLKMNGRLSFSDHHMKEDEIITAMTWGGLFRLASKRKCTYSFVKAL